MRRTVVLVSVAALAILLWPSTALAATTAPPLGTASKFAVLAGTTVTNTGPTIITGQLGVSPGTAVTGFPPGLSGPQHVADAVALKAQNNLTTAYNFAANQKCPLTNDYSNKNLGGLTLVPGVYCQTTAPPLTGTLTLNGSGIYIFQIGSTLVTAPAAKVVLINGARPCQIFWQVSSSATIDVETTMVGTIMALTKIEMHTGASLSGRALARNAEVTLDTNTIVKPGKCGSQPPS